MNSTLLSRTLFGAALFALGATTTLVAQGLGDSPKRQELRRVDLSGAAGMEVISSVAQYEPGDAIAPHFHHGVEAGYVLQGALVQYPGKEPSMLPTGANLLNLREVAHGGFKVVGTTPLRLYTVHVVDKGKALYDTPK